ncbi:DUF4169 family protein [Pseudophaeobacter sp. EL27]|uniref:DUF4169 family protein n=1 Tax=Pseudophaeobacter sp. EL27 TaxID=2107580 RepID=UPI000EFC17EF|nr:DUF4169 family protein [Pseudophaeobacter sp. EL27]
MGMPVNLNRYRKTQARAKDRARADENAVKFGRSKLEKELEKARAAKAKRDLDGHLDGDKSDQ